MSSKDEVRNFRLSFNELAQYAHNLVAVLERDLSELSIFGLTINNITQLNNLIEEFEEMKSDVEYEGDMMLKTEAKDAVAETLRSEIRYMSVRVEAAYNYGSVVYNTFRFEDMNNMNDIELLNMFRRVIRLSQQYYDELSYYGVTEDMIAQLNDYAENFQNALIQQEQAIDSRRIAAAERTKKANEIYYHISNYTNFGKKYFAKNNTAKYQDYIIYSDNVPGALTAPTNFTYRYDTFTFSWSAVNNATSYQLQSSNDNINFTNVNEGETNSFNINSRVPEHTYWRVRARNSGGFGDYSTIINIVNELVLNSPTNLQHISNIPELTWTAPAGATMFQVQLKNAASPDSEYLDIYYGNDVHLNHGDPIGNYTFRVRAWNAEGTSEWAEHSYTVVTP